MFWTGIIIIFVLAIIAGIMQGDAKSKEFKKQGEENLQKFNSLPDFNATKRIKGVNDTYIFGVDENSKKIAFVKKFHKEIVPFDQIISVEILEDNTILQQKSSLRTIGGAVVGGAIAGVGTEPPLHKAAAAAAPKRAAIVGIAIAQIAPADNPLLDFLS